MKKMLSILFAVMILFTSASLAEMTTPADGTYRGSYIDLKQVEVSVTMENGLFKEIKFRALGYKGEDYLKSEDKAMQGIASQYQALADYLIGKDVSALYDLYAPENIAPDVDAFTAATVRSSKLISAIHDAFNRGLYKLPEGGQPGATVTPTYADGTYRGGYIDPQQIEISITLENGLFTAIKFRALGYKGADYLKSEDKAMQGIASQYQALADYLIGKDVSALYDLYAPENIAPDVDGFTAATLRSSKLISAIHDALNRGVYTLPKNK